MLKVAYIYKEGRRYVYFYHLSCDVTENKWSFTRRWALIFCNNLAKMCCNATFQKLVFNILWRLLRYKNVCFLLAALYAIFMTGKKQETRCTGNRPPAIYTEQITFLSWVNYIIY